MGEARIGLAASDPTGTLCTPLEALVRTSFDEDIARLKALAAKHDVACIVVGLPVSMDGSRGTQARSVLAFSRHLRDEVDVPVHTWDERLSTAEAEARLREAGVQPSRDKGRVDSTAAALILESYLAAHRQTGRRPVNRSNE